MDEHAMFAVFLATVVLQLAYAVVETNDGQVHPLIIVSLDGMDWRILKDHVFNTPSLNFIAQSGVTAKYITNVVPSLTWPNHHSILTGLYSESHGIVSNIFWDPVYEEMFIFGFDCSNTDPKFYNDSEPLWLTVQKQGGRSASYFWPATNSYVEKPTYYEKETCLVDCSAINSKDLPKYRNRTLPGFPPYIHCAFDLRRPWSDRVNKVIQWLSSDEPPQFISLYFEEPDTTGHLHGPFSRQYKDAVENVDRNAVGFLLKRLNETNLLQKVNLIFVSDHGMDNTSSSRQVHLDKYIDPSSYFVSQEGALVHIWPHPGLEEAIYQNLTRNPIPHIRKVFRKEEIPLGYHWKNNRRISPIFIDPEVGWFVTRSANSSFPGNGEHGWPPIESKSYSIFYARGPAFRERAVVKPFKTVDLYPLMCKLLGVNPRPNNGSLENVRAVLKDDTPPNETSFVFPKLDLILTLVAFGLMDIYR